MHLKDLTMRVRVLQSLIDILRASGYPGYDNRGVNSAAQVARRLDERYVKKYGRASFTLAVLQEVVQVHLKQKQSIVQDKVATPPEAPKDVAEWDRTLRPHHIVAERSVRSQASIHEDYKCVAGPGWDQMALFHVGPMKLKNKKYKKYKKSRHSPGIVPA